MLAFLELQQVSHGLRHRLKGRSVTDPDLAPDVGDLENELSAHGVGKAAGTTDDGFGESLLEVVENRASAAIIGEVGERIGSDRSYHAVRDPALGPKAIRERERRDGLACTD